MGHNDHCVHEGEIKITPAICAGCSQGHGCPFRPEDPEDSVEWFLTENLCNECYKKIDGCDHQYDDALCMATRRHYSWHFKKVD